MRQMTRKLKHNRKDKKLRRNISVYRLNMKTKFVYDSTSKSKSTSFTT